jgi:hypothetical protein
MHIETQTLGHLVCIFLPEFTSIPLIYVWAGRDLNPRFPPCQGGVLTRLDHRPAVCVGTYRVISSYYTVFRIWHNLGLNINHTRDGRN